MILDSHASHETREDEKKGKHETQKDEKWSMSDDLANIFLSFSFVQDVDEDLVFISGSLSTVLSYVLESVNIYSLNHH